MVRNFIGGFTLNTQVDLQWKIKESNIREDVVNLF